MTQMCKKKYPSPRLCRTNFITLDASLCL